MNSVMFGMQFLFASYSVNNYPFLSSLQTKSWIITLVSSITPLCGIIVQPLTGYLTDNIKHKFGRRRMTMILGTVFTSVFQALCGLSEIISRDLKESHKNIIYLHKYGVL